MVFSETMGFIRSPRFLLRRYSNAGLPKAGVNICATQFAQIALVITEKAAFEDMRMKGFVQKDCAFAGHSLGEYSALASIAGVLHISALVDVVFYHGITMQRAVERDSENRSNYAMCAVNPSRISPTFSDAALREVVDSIATISGSLLEIVNYNVEVSFQLHFLFHSNFDRLIEPTICLCRRTRNAANHDQCPRPQGPEDQHR
jgi:malonyl CoA-acyl carrier protein transacylase